MRRFRMKLPSRETIESLRRAYPEGSRVELVEMEDAYAPPIGTKGTVRGVDDLGSILVSWDNGSSLSILYEIDRCKKIM